MLVDQAIVADQINIRFRGYSLIDHAQKPEPFLMAVPLLA